MISRNQHQKHRTLLPAIKPQVGHRQTAHFDPESGQVFTQTSVAVRTRQHSDWIGELQTPSLCKTMPSNAKGARSLSAIANTKTAREFRSLTAEHFASVPWPLAQRVWQEIVERHVDFQAHTVHVPLSDSFSHAESFHTWRTLAVSYPGPSEFDLPEYRYHLDIRQPSLALDSYFTGITSSDSSWLTALRISPKETRTADLVSISKVTNLGVLDLSDGQHLSEFKTSSTFDERVMRTWSSLASSPTDKAFSHLRVLLLGWQEHIDLWLFHYLPHFPNLSQLIVTDCPSLHQKNRRDWETLALRYGWEARRAKRSTKSLRSFLNEPQFPVGAVSALYYTALELDSAARPVLECWIGTPRKWTHILEDFPGTRTIYFDRVQKVVATPIHAPMPTANGKRSRERGGALSATSSPQPKRAPNPKLRTKASSVNSGELDALLAQYRE